MREILILNERNNMKPYINFKLISDYTNVYSTEQHNTHIVTCLVCVLYTISLYTEYEKPSTIVQHSIQTKKKKG